MDKRFSGENERPNTRQVGLGTPIGLGVGLGGAEGVCGGGWIGIPIGRMRA